MKSKCQIYFLVFHSRNTSQQRANHTIFDKSICFHIPGCPGALLWTVCHYESQYFEQYFSMKNGLVEMLKPLFLCAIFLSILPQIYT